MFDDEDDLFRFVDVSIGLITSKSPSHLSGWPEIGDAEVD
jgi:hypothetical protein